jgi:hypothetical protein
MDSFDARLKHLEKAMAIVAPGVRLVRIHDDPEREFPGPDTATIAGVVYDRFEGEELEDTLTERAFSQSASVTRR